MRARMVFIFCLLWAIVPFAALMGQEGKETSGEKPASEAEIERLIKELGAEEFAVREAAMKRLIEIGESAIPALKEALKSDDPEVVWRARRALEQIKGGEEFVKPPKRVLPPSWGREPFVPSEEWFEELRKRTEQMRKEALEELRRVFPGFAEEMERMERRFEEFPLPDFPDNFKDFLKRMEETNERLRKMLEGLKKELKKEEGEEKGGTRRIVIQAELSSSKKSGEHPRTKVQVYVWKDGVLVKEKEFFEGEPLLGLSIAGIPDVLRYHLKIGEGEGVIVESIDEKSPLYEAGLRTNDIILKVDDKTIKDYETLLSALEGKEKVRFTLLKAGEKKEIEVFLPRKENK